ncbi:methyl-accepting chemotaxis protein [Trichlorobacter lovleyi]|uniref:Methyl-accepting chemotaxis sensory transducer n=1 Tax=Trichlorobacter lovleyi (strain ATCC BAA-1151 / DSM 17278 / SZ) TaxID=398767 RepID=B3E1M1_TRIL1|nr:methyl-accepting chemotaxis protein [Trichlorobacter lovleyi]ACD94113.1 methyl-accepting chemotaxis sensory transducer [Trichlorobacter lovleyi SZ]
MFRARLTAKVLIAIAVTLSVGFACLGVLSLYLSYTSMLDLQRNNARQAAANVIHDLIELKMKGDFQAFNQYVDEVVKRGGALKIQLFHPDGKQYNGTENSELLKQAVEAGVQKEQNSVVDGKSALVLATPLANEARCNACHAAGPKFLGGLQLVTSLEEGAAKAKKLAVVLTGVGIFFFFLIIGVLYLLISRLVVRPIRELSAQVEDIAKGEGNLTKVLPVRSEDEIGHLAGEVNHLTQTVREIIASLYQQACMLGGNTCELSNATERIAKEVQEQMEHADMVATAAEEMSSTIQNVSENTHQAVDLSATVDSAASTGLAVVQETWQCMNSVSESVESTLAGIAELERSSASIGDMLSLIEDIADQTNLLALNAAIEAARAGEAGRGFAVVADEVRSLAEKTTKSTKDIERVVGKIQQESERAAASIRKESALVRSGLQQAEEARRQLEDIKNCASSSRMMSELIAVAAAEQTTVTGEISSKIHHISDAAHGTNQMMKANMETFARFADTVESIYGTVGRFSVGNYHDQVKAYAAELSNGVQAAIAEAIKSGTLSEADLFDRNYQPYPKKTDPPKFTTRFDGFFDRVVSPMQEAIVNRDSQLAYAICFDNNAYVPCHNLRFSKPLTGNIEQDRVNNRTKRIFGDHTGMRCAKNTDGVLLQTYRRDTGEILNDLSVPIFINGKHWGGIRFGYKAPCSLK